MVGLCDGDIHMLLLGLNLGLSDIVWLLFSDSDIVLLHFGLGDIVRFLYGLVDLLGDGDVVGHLDGVGAVVGVGVSLHVVVGAWHLLLNCGDVGLSNSTSVVGNFGLVDNLVWEWLGDEFVLNNGSGVVQSLSHILVQSCWYILSLCLPLSMLLHLCVGHSRVLSFVIALLGAGVLGCWGRAIGGCWGSSICRSRFGRCAIAGWRTSSCVVGLCGNARHKGSQ